MRRFTYEKVTNPVLAVEAATQSGSKFISGGTNLLDLMKLEIERPSHLIDISRLPMNEIERTPEGGLRIGAQALNSEVAANETVQKNYPVLSQALLSGASPQLRNKASIGGNLLQRTRCPYFYDSTESCNKRQPGSGCAAQGGFNRSHAILGGSDSCIAVHPSDMAVALVALGAGIELLDSQQTLRRVPIEMFHLLPNHTPHVETVIKSDELITAVLLPPAPRGYQLYRKVRDRASYEFALVSIALILSTENGRIHFIRTVFGGVAHKPWRADEAEAVLLNRPAKPEFFLAAADAALARATGRGHNDFKIELTKRTLMRALIQATEKSENI